MKTDCSTENVQRNYKQLMKTAGIYLAPDFEQVSEVVEM